MADERDTSESPFDRTWIAIDGKAKPQDPRRPDIYPIPEELAQMVIEHFSRPDDVVLDPYAGEGLIVLAAQALGRTAIGIERDLDRVRHLAPQLQPPSKVIQGDFKVGAEGDIPMVDLIFTSPPNSEFGGWDDELGYVTYWSEFDRLFDKLANALKPGGTLVIEVANLHEGALVRPVAFEVAMRLSQTFLLSGEFVRVNTGPTLAAMRANHTYLFVFRNTRTRKRRIEDVVVDKYL
jgi:DNA modification methylase